LVFVSFVPPYEVVVVDIIVSSCFGVFDLYFAGLDCYLSLVEYAVVESSVLTLMIGDFYFPNRLIEPINYDGFGRFTFFREFGRWLISGRNDSPVFYIFYNF
jgi:hypothetical protein